jgi:hypothetical protein
MGHDSPFFNRPGNNWRLRGGGGWFITRFVFDPQKTLQLRGPLRRLADTQYYGWRVWLFAAVALGGTVAAFLLPPLRQGQSYHDFADRRTLAGIPNGLNVLSNVGFLVAGLMGLRVAAERDRFIEPRERAAYLVFFAAICCACFGSGYYHWAPRDETLAWDRLPMTLAFMSLLAATIAERISAKAGWRLLWPLLGAGAASVWWWQQTGNLTPCAAAQYFSIFLIGLLILLFRPSYARGGDMLIVAVFYILAKAAEAQDGPIYTMTGWISGHTLKHLMAAAAVYWVARMLRKRAPLAPVARVAASSRPKLPVY